ncbi:MAG: hypothetical protein AAF692_13595 [Pseudomonadota bacterium]
MAAGAILAAGPAAANHDQGPASSLADLAAISEPESTVNDATAFYLNGVRVYPPEMFWVFVEDWQDNDWQQQSRLRTYVATNENPSPDVMMSMGATKMGAQVLAEVRPTVDDQLTGDRSVDEWWISNHRTFYSAWEQAKEARDERNKAMAKMGGAGVALGLSALYFGRLYKVPERLGVDQHLTTLREKLGKRSGGEDAKQAAASTPRTHKL